MRERNTCRPAGALGVVGPCFLYTCRPAGAKKLKPFANMHMALRPDPAKRGCTERHKIGIQSNWGAGIRRIVLL